jgi:hypothetical protein
MTEQQFALLCFLVLMQDIKTKAPSYIEEKTMIMDAGYDAFGYLDINNQRKVIDYLKTWNMDVPQLIMENFPYLQ